MPTRDYHESLWQEVPEGMRPPYMRARLDFLLAHVPPGARVLDVGCGEGYFAEELTEVLALWAAGTITPRIDATYPFTQAAEAHRRILSHGNTGKIILTPAG